MWSSIYRNPASSKSHGRSYVCQESESCNSESGFAQTTKMVDAPSAVGTPKLGFSWRSWDRWGRIWQPGSWEALWPLHHWNMSCILQPILQPLEDRGRFITDPFRIWNDEEPLLKLPFRTFRWFVNSVSSPSWVIFGQPSPKLRESRGCWNHGGTIECAFKAGRRHRGERSWVYDGIWGHGLQQWTWNS